MAVFRTLDPVAMILFFKFLVYNNGNIFIWGSEIVKLALNAPMPVRTKGLVNSFHNLKEIRLNSFGMFGSKSRHF